MWFGRYFSSSAVLVLTMIFYSGFTTPQPVFQPHDRDSLTSTPSVVNASIQPLNGTSLGAIDPDFQLVPQFKGRKLFPVSCLLVAVDAALQLALGDFEGTVTQKMVFKLDDHPQVEIVLLPSDEQGRASMPWKYAVWALNFSINIMIRNNRFQSSVFFILKNGQGLGALSYSLSQPAISDDPSEPTQDFVTNINRNDTHVIKSAPSPRVHFPEIVNSTDAIAYQPDFRVFFQLRGSKIKFNDVFISSLDLLREFSMFPRYARLVSDVTHVRTTNLYLGYRDANDPPRTKADPPYFENEWLLRALALMPGFMVSQQAFEEVSIKITVDQIMISELSLTKKRPTLSLATS